MIYEFEPGDKVFNPDNKEWGIGQVQSIIKEKITVNFENVGKKVINAENIKVTGNKFNDKKYYKHSLYPGGLKTKTFREVMEKNPERLIEDAVKGMLPKNKLGKSMIKKLKVFSGSEHDHESQQPIEWNPSI